MVSLLRPMTRAQSGTIQESESRFSGQASDACCGKQGWCPGESRPDWPTLTSTLLPCLDLVEFGKRSFEFGIEEPHRIKNFAEGCGRSRPVGFPECEDAIVSQVPHDR